MIASASHPRQSRRSSLRLLEEFRLFVDGEAIALPRSVERVVAFLGVCPHLSVEFAWQLPCGRTSSTIGRTATCDRRCGGCGGLRA
jgi:hypothetical protein